MTPFECCHFSRPSNMLNRIQSSERLNRWGAYNLNPEVALNTCWLLTNGEWSDHRVSMRRCRTDLVPRKVRLNRDACPGGQPLLQRGGRIVSPATSCSRVRRPQTRPAGKGFRRPALRGRERNRKVDRLGGSSADATTCTRARTRA